MGEGFAGMTELPTLSELYNVESIGYSVPREQVFILIKKHIEHYRKEAIPSNSWCNEAESQVEALEALLE